MPENRSTAPARRAAIYTRISLDATGEGLGVTRQEDDARKLIAARGWECAGLWSDNSISASSSKKQRPGYDALVTAYDAGQFDALVCWDLDRLTRQPRQLEDWIEAAEGKGLALVTTNGEADLTTDGGRMYARIKLAVARAEVERKAARQRAAALQRAQLGRPPLGVRLTGYTAKGEVVADEAAVVRQIFTMFYDGDSLKGIARALSDDGVSTRHGKPWNPSSVRDILTNPRYAGRVIYDRQVLDGVRGNWEPLVTDEVFDVVQARLDDPKRKTSRTGTDRRHLGSGLYRCADCGEPLSGWSGGRYRCKAAHVNRARGQVDGYVLDVITERLAREDIADVLRPVEQSIAPLLDEAKRLRARLAAVDAEYDADIIDGVRWRTKTERIKVELGEIERQLSSAHSGSALGAVLNTPDPVAAFLDAPLMAKRAIIDTLCEVRLRKGTRGSKTFNPETVVVEWRA